MPDIDLKRLRGLRRRAEATLQTLVSDLKPFRHDDKQSGFLRTPHSESISGDVNVTTTCSCLMALALTGRLGDFYADDLKDNPNIVASTFQKLLTAPWMSSGLAENNAFTTTLILRTLGFLVHTASVPLTVATKPSAKAWEPQLDIRQFEAFARKLVDKTDSLSRLLFGLMPKPIQMALEKFIASGSSGSSIKRTITNEIGRIVRTTALYDESRFKGATLSKATQEAIGKSADAYTTAHTNRLLLDDYFGAEISPIASRSLHDIATMVSADPEYFRINDYASAAAIVYWFVDGVTRAKLSLPENNWEILCKWATLEFARQRSLVVAKHAAMMDPVAMAMAACLCARLRSISNNSDLGASSAHQSLLPSTIELEQSVLELIDEQTKSGIWPKYFPLFHYQEAGSNFCFTFELLEGVLAEFSNKDNRLIRNESFIHGLERAVTWCERNRVSYSRADRKLFAGWNSGGLLDSLRKEQPESWATAVVHMFLWELVDVLSRHIQERLLEQYAATLPNPQSPRLRDLLDIELWIDEEHKSLQGTLSTGIVKSFENVTDTILRTRPPKKGPLSALLFGPPGTSKTQISKAVANELGWPLVEIDPSHFLQSSFQNIYLKAETIFEDIADLYAVVVLFDEMDALVQKRDATGMPIDTESKFLTTYMLPKLAAMHDSGRVVFFMATNFQENFDDAIKRAGRFDLLLCMGPPTLKAKCGAIQAFYHPPFDPTSQTKRAGERILAFCEKDRWLQQQLELYTFGEFKSLLAGIRDKSAIGDAIDSLALPGFLAEVKRDSHTAMLRFDDVAPILKEYGVETISELDKKHEVDFKRFGLEKRAVRYLRDRQQSKRQ
jgi:ATPase family protein associated with various cellular activities (AAA)